MYQQCNKLLASSIAQEVFLNLPVRLRKHLTFGECLVGKMAVAERRVSVIVVNAARDAVKLQEEPTLLRSRVGERENTVTTVLLDTPLARDELV